MIELGVSRGLNLVKEAVFFDVSRKIFHSTGLDHGVYEVRALKREDIRQIAGGDHGLELHTVISGHSVQLKCYPRHVLFEALDCIVVGQNRVIIRIANIDAKRSGLVLVATGGFTGLRGSGVLCRGVAGLLISAPTRRQAEYHRKREHKCQSFFHSPLLLNL